MALVVVVQALAEDQAFLVARPVVAEVTTAQWAHLVAAAFFLLGAVVVVVELQRLMRYPTAQQAVAQVERK